MSPCFKCGARASCRHREAELPAKPVAIGPERKDLRTYNRGQGYNFKGERAERLFAAMQRMRTAYRDQ